MSEDLSYICTVIRKIINIVLIILGVYFGIKLAIFYMPFLIAFVISLIIEPAIRFFMNKTKSNRKISSIIIFIIVFAIIIGAVTWAIVSLISESTNLLQMLNLYINKAYTQVQESISKLSIEKLNVSKDIINMFQNTSQEILVKLSNWMTQFLTNLIEIITSIPAMAIYVVITIMSLYFMCTDKIYMLDLLEHHMPQKWVRKLGKHIREINWNKLEKKNENCIAWITIPGTVVDYPIVRTNTYNYYLIHDINNDYSQYGTLFFDCRLYKRTLKSKNLIIYGHNMGHYTDVMFSSLMNYRDIKYAKKHKRIYLYTRIRKFLS